jgi:phage-related holin
MNIDSIKSKLKWLLLIWNIDWLRNWVLKITGKQIINKLEKSKGERTMNKIILGIALPVIMKIIEELLSAENIKTYGDKLFDIIETMVASSENTIDDIAVLPVIKALRDGLNIHDND